jgi:transposase
LGGQLLSGRIERKRRTIPSVQAEGSVLNWKRILQTDGYAAYDQVGGPNLVHAACWSHLAIHFKKVLELNPRDPLATPIVEHIRDLFAIDSGARQRGLSLPARQTLRLKSARPLLVNIRKQIETARAMALPASALGKACQYTLHLWEKLTRFLEHPELELSNNPPENSMGPVAVGRKNWIYVGSAQAG